MSNQKIISLTTIVSSKILGAIGHEKMHAFETRVLHDASCNVSVIRVYKNVISDYCEAEVWNADQEMTS
jgi:hypothetical protein